jgi:large subunit ribosomal protein L24
MAKIKKGDLVQVITGATEERGGYRGKQGHVLAVIKETNKVIVEGVNMVTKHVKVGQTDRAEALAASRPPRRQSTFQTLH